MKDTSEFLKFQEVFKKYQTLFGLNGYKVYFEYKPLTSHAIVVSDENDMRATATLSSKKMKSKDSKASAKHEAIHLLLGKLSDKAYKRFVTSDEIYAAEEELTVKLEKLIPDIESGKE